jgi:hypothetical protein
LSDREADEDDEDMHISPCNSTNEDAMEDTIEVPSIGGRVLPLIPVAQIPVASYDMFQHLLDAAAMNRDDEVRFQTYLY